MITRPILSGLLISVLWPCLAAAQTADETAEEKPEQTAETPVIPPQPAEPVQPDWQICNETSYALRVAVATMVEDKMQPRGWSKIRAGSCLDVVAPPGTPKFLIAESSPAHRGGVREWKGETPMCASSDDFVADIAIGCPLQDLSTKPYLSVDPEERITTLVEIDDFGSKAGTAGIQRLLRDNGYDISRIDGMAGRRTSRTLATFLKDKELSTSLTPEEQLDALETAALEKVKEVGLTICNKSSATVWTAIGRRRKGNWESKGWWSIKKEECGQIFNDTLISADVSFYALQDGIIDEEGAKGDDRTLRAVSATPSQFCVADARFAVLGRENCADLGYQAANFRALPIDKEGLTIDLTDADFASPGVSGLRQ